ncbi:MAG: M48 family metallopeptidase [Micavibrio sp.]|nr:M48 family metallopeptidase [Micavibrio sp.]
MSRIFFCLLFLVLWLPCILFMTGNTSLSPPLPAAEKLQGPFEWHKLDMRFTMHGLAPDMRIAGARELPDKTGVLFIIRADFIEWLYGGGHMSHHIKLGPVYETQIKDRPYVTRWDLEHDAGLQYSIGALRFNGMFIMAALLVLVMPVLFLFWLMADDITIMTPEERKRRDDAFAELVKVIEAKAQHNPAWLRQKTIRLALLGYVVVFGSIFLMLPLGLGLAAVVVVLTGGNAAAAKLAFIVAAVPIGFAFHLAKSLLLQTHPPEGVEITPAAAPELFKWLGQMIATAKGPRFKHVYISSDLNASVARNTGALGFFGFGPVTLTLGLPLMQALTLPQLGAVVGHEYGHVAAKDNALGHWVYRIRNSWLSLGGRLHLEKLWYALRLNRFYDWFIGVFSAYSFALSRRCEYEADAFSARLAGAQHNAEALAAVAIRSTELGQLFWLDLWKKAEQDPDVAAIKPFHLMPAFFAGTRDQQRTIAAVQNRTTDYASTHPATMDRIHALKAEFTVPQPMTVSAARELLGPLELQLADRFSAAWQADAAPHWRTRHGEHTAAVSRHAALSEKPLEMMTREELGELIGTASTLQDDSRVLQASEEILRRDPGSPGARLNIMGIRLSQLNDETQLQELEKLAAEHPQFLPNACHHAIDYFEKVQRRDAADIYREKIRAWEYARMAAEEERNLILDTDTYEAHGLSAEIPAAIAAVAARHRIISAVYLARKRVKYLGEFPSYQVGFRLRRSSFQRQATRDKDLRSFLQDTHFPAEYVLVNVGAVRGLEAKLKKIPGALIYSDKNKQTNSAP